ncbi:MAG TPA: hypothetical protein VK253_05515 [Candidatus Binatia bacterium]|nr:hypothetical protein [Candidatus Binatia bacterium]
MRKIALALTFSVLSFLVVASTVTLLAADNNWVSKAGMHEGRSDLGVATVDGKIYAIGGIKKGGFSSYSEQYDPAGDSWTYKASMPTSRSAFGIAVFENKIYCIGGYTLLSGKLGATAANEVYDPATDTWETKASMPTPRINVEANVVNGKIYVFGGSGFGERANETLNQVYNPATDSWTTKAPVPTAVPSYASAVIGTKIYVFTSRLTQIYDAQNDSWSLGAPAPSPVMLAKAASTAGLDAPERIYVFGADAKEPYWQLTTEGFITQSYNPQNDSWALCPSMPAGRYDVGVGVIGDLIYTIGGFTTKFNSESYFDLNPIYIYSSENQRYTPIGYGTVPPTITFLSPNNTTYSSGNISLVFMTNKPVVWQAYSFDDQEKTPLTGNITLTDIPSGLHSITVYATDPLGKNATPQTIMFRIASPETPATVPSIAVGSAIAVVFVAALMYSKRLKNRT